MIPDSILTNVTLIKTLSTEFAGQKITPIPVDIATGFFYSHAEKLYLITNKHVIYGDDFWSEAATPRVSLFSILLHENPKNLTLKRWVDVPLIVDGRNMWLEHLRRVDVVVVLLPPDITPQNYAITPLAIFLRSVDLPVPVCPIRYMCWRRSNGFMPNLMPLLCEVVFPMGILFSL